MLDPSTLLSRISSLADVMLSWYAYMVTAPRTKTVSLQQASGAPFLMHWEQGIRWSHLILRLEQQVQLRGARCVARRAATEKLRRPVEETSASIPQRVVLYLFKQRSIIVECRLEDRMEFII